MKTLDSTHGPCKPGRRQRQVMAELGLPDFETVQQCSDRQRLMVRRFERAGELQHEMDWQASRRRAF
jgi:hypothetical protein